MARQPRVSLKNQFGPICVAESMMAAVTRVCSHVTLSQQPQRRVQRVRALGLRPNGAWTRHQGTGPIR